LWEAEKTVIMDRISSVLPLLVVIPEMRKIRCEGIAVKEDCMMGVNIADGMVDAIVKLDHTRVRGISWFVERVIPRDPGVVAIVFGEFLPEPNNPVLEIFVKPECSNMGPVVRVPVRVLSPRSWKVRISRRRT
jgi:hypothetical protein